MSRKSKNAALANKLTPKTGDYAKTLAPLCGANGNTKRIRTVIQATALIKAVWAEKDRHGNWWVANGDYHRLASGHEIELLDKAQKQHELSIEGDKALTGAYQG